MIKPRIRVINRHGFLAYRVIEMPVNVFSNSIIWFNGKRYISGGNGHVYFSPGDQPRLKPRLTDLISNIKRKKLNPYY